MKFNFIFLIHLKYLKLFLDEYKCPRRRHYSLFQVWQMTSPQCRYHLKLSCMRENFRNYFTFCRRNNYWNKKQKKEYSMYAFLRRNVTFWQISFPERDARRVFQLTSNSPLKPYACRSCRNPKYIQFQFQNNQYFVVSSNFANRKNNILKIKQWS